MAGVRYRTATSNDATSIAYLHAASWQRHYRGAYSDLFLDYDVVADRLAVWTERTQQAQPDEYTLIAECDHRIVGFAHTILDDDPIWGALLENLHVSSDRQRRGVGTQLLARTARLVLDRALSRGLYLWVLEQNAAAQAFYRAMGGTYVESGLALAPGGDPARLNGSPSRLRFVWPDPSALLDPCGDSKGEAR